MQEIKKRERTQRFGVLLPIEWRDYLWEQAEKSHRSPPKYVEMLLERDKQLKERVKS